MKTGIRVYCRRCGLPKLPHGRSAAWDSSWCKASKCIDYENDPKPGCLWPGETAEEFGYPCCDHATEDR